MHLLTTRLYNVYRGDFINLLKKNDYKSLVNKKDWREVSVDLKKSVKNLSNNRLSLLHLQYLQSQMRMLSIDHFVSVVHNCIPRLPIIESVYSISRDAGFHSATKFWGGSATSEWALSLGRLWDVFFGKFLDASRLLLGNFLRQKQNISSLILCIVVIYRA